MRTRNDHVPMSSPLPVSGASGHVAPPVPGVRLGQVLGQGGFATVYAGEQVSLGRPVAVKIDSRPLHDERNRRRFMREMAAASRISGHPNAVSLIDSGVLPDGRPYLVMERCDGGSLAQVLQRGGLSAAQAVSIVTAVCSALGAAHDAGVLHRDIKPASILLTPFGRPVLGDFGIAAPIGLSIEKDEFGGASPPWASPEQQLDRESLTPASDVYALAATIYTLLAGRSPHVDVSGADRNDQLSMIDRVLHRQIPPIGRHDIPEQLERVLATAMAKSPRGRYASAVALARALQQVQTDLCLTITQLDVMEDASGRHTSGNRNQDSTMLRPAVTVDPDGPTGTVPAAHRHDDAATTFAPRRVKAQPAGSASASSALRPGSALPSQDDEAEVTRDDPGSKETEAGLRRRRRPSGRAVAVTVVGTAVMVCLSAIGVWSVL